MCCSSFIHITSKNNIYDADTAGSRPLLIDSMNVSEKSLFFMDILYIFCFDQNGLYNLMPCFPFSAYSESFSKILEVPENPEKLFIEILDEKLQAFVHYFVRFCNTQSLPAVRQEIINQPIYLQQVP